MSDWTGTPAPGDADLETLYRDSGIGTGAEMSPSVTAEKQHADAQDLDKLYATAGTPEPQAPPAVMDRAWWNLPGKLVDKVTAGDWTSPPVAPPSAITNQPVGSTVTPLVKRVPEEERDTPSLFDTLAPKSDFSGSGPTDPATPEEQKFLAGVLFNARPDQLTALALQAYPGAKAIQDSRGNPMIQKPDGTRLYISKPGLRSQDVVGLLGDAGVASLFAAAPELALAGRIGAGWVPSLVRAVAHGAAQVGAGGAEGEVIREMGGGSGADPIDLLARGIGGGGGAAIKDIAQLWRSRWSGAGTLLADSGGAPDTAPVTKGMLTTTGQQLFQQAGKDPGVVTIGQLKDLQTKMGPAGKQVAELGGPPAPGAPSAARANVESAQYGVDMSTGVRTQQQPQLNAENQMKFGPTAPQATGYRTTQLQQVRDAQGRVLETMTGAPPETEGKLGDTLKTTIRDKNDALTTATKDAYAKLGPDFTPASESALGKGGMFFTPGTGRLVLSDALNVATGANARLTPNGLKALATLTDLTSTKTPNGVVIPRGFNLAEFDQARRELGDLADQVKRGLAGGTTNRTDYRMVTQLKAALDARADAAPGLGLAQGDTSRLGLLRDAQRAHEAQMSFVKPDDSRAAPFMTDLLAKDSDGNYLGRDGQQVVDALHGKTGMGHDATPQILDHLQGQFTGDAPAQQAIRRPGLQRLMVGSKEPAPDAMPYQGEASRFREAMSGNDAAIVDRLAPTAADKEQLNGLRGLADTLSTQRQLGSSGTAQLRAQQWRDYIKSLPFGIGSMVAPHMEDSAQTGAKLAFGGRMRPEMFPGYRVPRNFVLAPGGGLLGDQTYELGTTPSGETRGRR
jgi:hypothetical protein